MGRRRALLIATYEYEDAALSRLTAPAHDAEALAAILRDPEVAGFEVTQLINEPHYRAGAAIGDFYRDTRRDDLTLLYFTGHGLKDDAGRLYLAAANTRRDGLLFTAIAAEQIDQAMEGSPSRQKVLILDCCYSGAFPAGRLAKGDTAVHTLERFQGRGRSVLTASDATQYSFEGSRAEGEAPQSVFTGHLVEGLRDGNADLDGDGDISLDELYTYVHDRVVEEQPGQRPKKQDDVEGRIVIARNTRWSMPSYLRHALDSPLPADRLNAIDGLARVYAAGNEVVRDAVRVELHRLADDDSRAVQTAARQGIDAVGTPAPRPMPTPAAAARKPAPAAEKPVERREARPSVAPAWPAIAGVVLLIAGVALPWAKLEKYVPPLSITQVFQDRWAALFALAALCGAVAALSGHLRPPWARVTALGVTAVAAVAMTIRGVPLLVGNRLDALPGYYADRSLEADKGSVLLCLAGVWCLVAAAWPRDRVAAVFGPEVVWSKGDSGRRTVKRVFAVSTAVLAAANVIILWFRIGVGMASWTDPPTALIPSENTVVAPWEYLLFAVLLILLSVELAVSAETGYYQRWLNPVRAVVLLGYAAALGEGSGYLYWFSNAEFDFHPWVAVLPAVLAAIASVLLPGPAGD